MEERVGTDPRTGGSITIKVPTGKLTPVGAPRVQSFTLAADGQDIIQVSALKNGRYKLRLMTNQPFIEEMLRSLVLVSTTATDVTDEDFKQIQEFLIDFVDKVNVVFN
jgi:hypothetical protein